MLSSSLRRFFNHLGARTAQRHHLPLEQLEGRQLLANPVLDALPNVSIPLGKAVLVPITASDADGDSLTYTVTSTRGDIQAKVHTGNPYLRLTVTRPAFGNTPALTGTLTFELLKDVAPKTVRRITGLVNAGFYDGLSFHRLASLIGTKILQGGDPQGTGSGGPVFRFEDEMDADTLFGARGVLAMANSGQDTNGSQFFITDGPLSFLNLRHNVFGQLVRGRDVLAKLLETPTTGPSPTDPEERPNRPTVSLTITDAEIIQNKTDAVITVSVDNQAAADGVIVVTAKDPAGHTVSKQFNVVRTSDANDAPIFQPGAPKRIYMTPGQAFAFNVTTIDVENDDRIFSARVLEGTTPVGFGVLNVTYETTGNKATRKVTLTPGNAITNKVLKVELTVRDTGSQHVHATDTIEVIIDSNPRITDAKAVGFTTATGVNADRLVATFKFGNAAAVASDFSATVKWGDNDQTLAGDVEITTNGDTFEVRAPQGFNNPGVYDFDVAITGPNNAKADLTGTAIAGNLAFTGQAVTVNQFSLEQFNNVQVAKFTLDPLRTIADYTATIDWGDSSSSAGTIVPLGGYTFAVLGGHKYQQFGNRTIKVTVKDSAGHEVVVNSTGNINLPPIRVAGGADASVNEGGRFTRTVTFTDPIGGNWTATVDYGDGTVVNVAVNRQNKSLLLDHVYDASKVHTLKITVKDGDSTRTGADTVLVTAVNKAPSITVGGDSSGVRGQLRTLILSAVDPSRADNKGTFTYRINWGDGSNEQVVTGPATHSVVHAFGVEGSHRVTVRAVDKDGAASSRVTKTYSIKIAQMQTDPYDSSKKALAVGGTTGKDNIRIDNAGSSVRVTYGSTIFGTFNPTGRVMVFGGNADDKITVAPSLNRPLHLEGGGGNDVLLASGGADVLLGNSGNDSLVGAGGRDLLVGGAGRDSLVGGNDDDLLVADTLTHDVKASALALLMREWTRTDQNAAQRLSHLQGLTSGGRNGRTKLDEAALGVDRDADVLTGQQATDVFFLNTDSGTRDSAKDRAKNEKLIDID